MRNLFLIDVKQTYLASVGVDINTKTFLPFRFFKGFGSYTHINMNSTRLYIGRYINNSVKFS